MPRLDRDGVVATAVDLARPLAGRAGPTLGAIKEQLYAGVLDALRTGAARLPGPSA